MFIRRKRENNKEREAKDLAKAEVLESLQKAKNSNEFKQALAKEHVSKFLAIKTQDR